MQNYSSVLTRFQKLETHRMAFFRREVIISFPNRFEGNSEDQNLHKKLGSNEELSGIFNVLMTALRVLLKKQRLYLNKKPSSEKEEEV